MQRGNGRTTPFLLPPLPCAGKANEQQGGSGGWDVDSELGREEGQRERLRLFCKGCKPRLFVPPCWDSRSPSAAQWLNPWNDFSRATRTRANQSWPTIFTAREYQYGGCGRGRASVTNWERARAGGERRTDGRGRGPAGAQAIENIRRR